MATNLLPVSLTGTTNSTNKMKHTNSDRKNVAGVNDTQRSFRNQNFDKDLCLRSNKLNHTKSDRKFVADVNNNQRQIYYRRNNTGEEQKINKYLNEPFIIIQNDMTIFHISRARVKKDSKRKRSFRRSRDAIPSKKFKSAFLLFKQTRC